MGRDSSPVQQAVKEAQPSTLFSVIQNGVFVASPGTLQAKKSKNLEACGVEVVQADLDDRASLAKAFQEQMSSLRSATFGGIYNDPKNQNKPEPGQALNEWTKVQETQQTQECH
ncbi:hypothetical protein FVEG_02546 [Fusarium verticillioides 7600]|uniref:Uncharacterized protein n=1 Tax=Gibberella moniliformis (strain M3125 / FGSC 7600) TaxID=334819 RepID=W7LKJ7_GIBM7|nr:hypothetical protein FVEG_02546 [Fusarium verticillioides 7600]EWG39918.1 hypothetical protein FVEG_02546 [Fusarium verticillioides 7600]